MSFSLNLTRICVTFCVLVSCVTSDAQKLITYDPPFVSPVKTAPICPETYREYVDDYSGFPKLIYKCYVYAPDKCSNYYWMAEVDVLFDVNTDGKPGNVRIKHTTHECVNSAVAISVYGWRFEESRSGARDLSFTVEANSGLIE